MRERRVVPLRLMPTMKTGESLEDFDAVGCSRPLSGSDNKKIPQKCFSASQFAFLETLAMVSLNAPSRVGYIHHMAPIVLILYGFLILSVASIRKPFSELLPPTAVTF